MSRSSRFVSLLLSALIIVLTVSGVIDAQRRAVPRHPTHPEQAVVLRGHVFIGGYFYDPFFGPYPWWRRQAYPYWYYPVYDQRAEVRLTVEPVLKTGNVGVAGSTGTVLHRSLKASHSPVTRSLAEVRLTQGIQNREQFPVAAFIEEVASASTLDANARGVRLIVAPVKTAW